MSRRQEFDEFVVARSPRLLRVAYLLTRDWATAEDLLQAALVKAWFAWDRMESDPEPYVRRILVNTNASRWRRRWRGEEPVADIPQLGGASPDPHAEVDIRDWVWRSLARLPRRQRAVLVLRYYEGLTEAEIADVMRCSIGTVKSQASKAMAKLRLDESLGVRA